MQEVIDFIGQCPELSEPKVLLGTVHAVRRCADGRDIDCQITVWENPAQIPRSRYSVEVVGDDGKRFATGNPAPTVADALVLANWAQLDRP